MKYTLDIVIDAPLNICAKTFSITENMINWQTELISIAHISGNPNEFGARMKLNFKIGKRQMPIIETITHKDLPHALHCTYASKDMDYIQENYFSATLDNKTKWTSINEYTPLNFKMRLMLWTMPQTFKKQSLRFMKDFKNFAEKEISVSHA